MNYNKIVLGGRLTADPDFRTLPSGEYMTKFRVASNRIWRDPKSGNRREDACFIDVTAFGRKATLIRDYFHKGNNILVEGRLRHEVWEDEQKKVKSRHSVVVESIAFVDPKPKEADLDVADAADQGAGDDHPVPDHQASNPPPVASSPVASSPVASSATASPTVGGVASGDLTTSLGAPPDLFDSAPAAGARAEAMPRATPGPAPEPGSSVARRHRERTLVAAAELPF